MSENKALHKSAKNLTILKEAKKRDLQEAAEAK
jgi:hypothetical protein